MCTCRPSSYIIQRSARRCMKHFGPSKPLNSKKNGSDDICCTNQPKNWLQGWNPGQSFVIPPVSTTPLISISCTPGTSTPRPRWKSGLQTSPLKSQHHHCSEPHGFVLGTSPKKKTKVPPQYRALFEASRFQHLLFSTEGFFAYY